jgi:O-antigen/teichoic acid export membrane protein
MAEPPNSQRHSIIAMLLPKFFIRYVDNRPKFVEILDNIGWLFLDKILRMGLGLFVGVWVVRYLGPGQFGLLNYALAFTGLFGAIATLGLQGIVVRDIVRDPDGVRLTLGTAAFIQIVGGLVSYFLILGVIAYIRPDDPLARSIVAILGAVMLFRASEIAIYWFESQVQSKYTVWVQSIVFLIFAAIKVVLILNKAPLIAFAWIMLLEALAVALILIMVMGHLSYSLSLLRVSVARAKTLIRDSWPLALAGIAVPVYMRIDQIMLGQIIGDEAVGIFSAATRISEVWYFIPMIIVASVSPAILEAKKRNKVQYFRRMQKLYDLLVIMSVSIALPMTFLSTTMIKLLFGSSYAESGAVLAIHIWASVFVCFGVASSQYLLAENRQIIALQRTLAGMTANIGLNILLIPAYGPMGAAIATVLSQSVATLFFDYFQKETRIMFRMKARALNPCRMIKFILRANKEWRIQVRSATLG